MNLVSYLLLAVIAVLFVLAVRYSRKHGSCEACGGNCAVHAASGGGCSAGCASCGGSCDMSAMPVMKKESKE